MPQRWRIEKAGDMARLQLQSFALEPLDVDAVRVTVKAVGLNFADIFALTGLYSATPKGAFTPGLEFSGVVAQSRSAKFHVGDKVMGCIRFGAYSSVVDVQAHQLYPLPSDWSFEQGAAYLVQTMTAWYALSTLGAVSKDKLTLIQSAAGGVGLQAMNICKALQVPTIATVSSEAKADYLRAHFATEVIVRASNFAQQLAQTLNGRALLLVLDAVGGKVQRDCFKSLAPTGRLVVFGAAEFTPGQRKPNWLHLAWKYLTRPKYDALAMISDNTSVMAFNLIWLWQNQSLFEQLLQELQALALPAPLVGHSFPFAEAHEALQCLRSGQSMGKVVLVVNEDNV